MTDNIGPFGKLRWVALSPREERQVLAGLIELVREACPLDHFIIGNIGDKSTWRVRYSKEAMPEQIANAKERIANFEAHTIMAGHGLDPLVPHAVYRKPIASELH